MSYSSRLVADARPVLPRASAEQTVARLDVDAAVELLVPASSPAGPGAPSAAGAPRDEARPAPFDERPAGDRRPAAAYAPGAAASVTPVRAAAPAPLAEVVRALAPAAGAGTVDTVPPVRETWQPVPLPATDRAEVAIPAIAEQPPARIPTRVAAAPDDPWVLQPPDGAPPVDEAEVVPSRSLRPRAADPGPAWPDDREGAWAADAREATSPGPEMAAAGRSSRGQADSVENVTLAIGSIEVIVERPRTPAMPQALLAPAPTPVASSDPIERLRRHYATWPDGG